MDNPAMRAIDEYMRDDRGKDGWRRPRDAKPPPGQSVLVYRRDTDCMHMAWWDGRRWWTWGFDDNCKDEKPLPFRPSHWRLLPAKPIGT